MATAAGHVVSISFFDADLLFFFFFSGLSFFLSFGAPLRSPQEFYLPSFSISLTAAGLNSAGRSSQARFQCPANDGIPDATDLISFDRALFIALKEHLSIQPCSAWLLCVWSFVSVNLSIRGICHDKESEALAWGLGLAPAILYVREARFKRA